MNLKQNFIQKWNNFFMTNDDIAKAKIVFTCKQILESNIDLIEGTRKLANFLLENNIGLNLPLDFFLKIKEGNDSLFEINRFEFENKVRQICNEIIKNLQTPLLEVKYNMVNISKKILSKEIDLLRGCQKMSGCVELLRYWSNEECDDRFLEFIGISSELETSPLDPEWRSRIDPKALAKQDLITEEYRKAITPSVLEDCKEIIKKFDYS